MKAPELSLLQEIARLLFLNGTTIIAISTVQRALHAVKNKKNRLNCKHGRFKISNAVCVKRLIYD